METIQLDRNITGYWKRSTAIMILVFVLITFSIVLAYLTLKLDAEFFLNYLQSTGSLTSPWSIVSLLGFVGGYLYLLFYIEHHQAFIQKENTKEAKLTKEVFMLFRMMNYFIPVVVIYLIFVSKAYLLAGVVLALLAITELAFKPIAKDFQNIIYNYKSLEVLEPANIYGPVTKSRERAFDDLHNIREKVKERKKDESILRTILQPYARYVPAMLYGTVWTIIKQGGPHVKNSIVLLTFLVMFIMLPTGLNANNIIVVTYTVLTLIYWFWTSSVVFSGFPECKLEVHLKDGRLYEKVYRIEDNPEGYHLYLDAKNNILKVKNDELEKEIPLLASNK